MITSGVIFNVGDAELLFASGKGIVVLPGAILDIGGYASLLSNHTLGGNTDWHGVEVRGISTSSNPASQGRLEFKNGNISNAEVGVSNYNRFQNILGASTSGGIIQISDATMSNCKQHLQIARYSFLNHSSFKEVDFLWNATGPYALDQNFAPMIEIYRNALIPFSYCNFHNTNTNIFFSGDHISKAAIYAYGGATVTVVGDASLNYSFEGFKYGVVGVSSRPSFVRNMQFNCYRGIWFRNMLQAVVADCQFEHIDLSYLPLIDNVSIPNSSQNLPLQYGVFIEDCTGYDVSNNFIDFPNSTEADDGIFIVSSGTENNLLYRNTINHCRRGIYCHQDNRNDGGSQGLKLECNALSDCFGGITVTDNTPGTTDEVGIHNLQGTQVVNSMLSSGNYFDNTGGVFNNNWPNDGYHIWNENGVGHVYYYYVALENLQEWDGNIDAYILFNGNPVQDNPQCTYGLASMGEGARSMALEHHEEMLVKEAALEAVVDGGDSDALTMEVILTEYGEALELYYELMSASPNLSKEVVIQTILKEAELPPSLLTLILQSNPISAKSTEVQERLDQRGILLSDYQRYMIDQAMYLYSEKEQLERELDYHRFSYDLHLNRGIKEIISVDTVGLGGDQVEELIEGIARPTDYQFLAAYALGQGDHESAMALMEQVATDFNLSPAKAEENEDLTTCMAIEIDINNDQRTILTSSELEVLESIATKTLGRANGHAIALLEDYAGYVHYEAIPDEDFGKSTSGKDEFQFDRESNYSIYPLPATDYLMIELNIERELVYVEIRDVLGRLALGTDYQSTSPLDLRSVESGSYVITVFNKGNVLLSESIKIE